MRENIREKGNRFEDRVSLVFCLYALFTIVIYTLPMLKITLPYILVALILLASLFFFMYKNAKWMYMAIVLCLASLLIATINLMTGAYALVDSINEMVRNIRFFIPVFWGCYVLKYSTEKQRKFILVVFGIMCGYILFKTLDALEEVPGVCRELAKSTTRHSAELSNFRRENVGGFEYSYMMGIVTMGFVWSAVKSRNTMVRIVCVIASVVCYYFIIQTMYTLLLILTFVGTISIFFFATTSKVKKAVLIMGSIAMFIFMEPIFEGLAEFFSFNYVLEEKFTSMYLALKYDDVEMVGSRPELLFNAFIDWTENPIFGGKHTDQNSHSFIMTYLVNSGLIGFSVWMGFFVMSWRMLRKEISKIATDLSLFDSAMIYIFLLAAFNPIGYVFEVVFAVFFIVPIWSVTIRINGKELSRTN